MRDREVACQFYEYEGCCTKGRAGTFRKQCQTCSKYDPVPHGQPARKNLKNEKRDKFMKDKRNWE